MEEGAPMCGRFTLTTPAQQLANLFNFEMPSDDNEGLFPRFNIAPTQDVAAVRVIEPGEAASLVPLRWGLIPSWAKDTKIGNRLINARAETISELPSFRDPFRSRRCLILADGFFEWKKSGDAKLPYYIRRADHAPFAFAGLWDRWRGVDEVVESCAIITTTANELLEPLHQRMPVILDPDAFADWLDPRMKRIDHLKGFLRTFPADEMELTAVGMGVNDARFDDPSCVRPVGTDGASLMTTAPMSRTAKRSRSDQPSLWNCDES